MNEAERQQLTDPLSLTALCDRYPDTPGRKALQQAIERAQHGTTITRSELEDAFLASRAAFESDRARDRGLQSAGWRVVRVTWRQLRDDERALAAELGALLAH